MTVPPLPSLGPRPPFNSPPATPGQAPAGLKKEEGHFTGDKHFIILKFGYREKVGAGVESEQLVIWCSLSRHTNPPHLSFPIPSLTSKAETHDHLPSPKRVRI